MYQPSVDAALERMHRWDGAARTSSSESVSGLRNELKTVMENHCSVFRNEQVMRQGVEQVEALVKRLADVRIGDQSQIFNTARVEALELENLMGVALATMHSAYARKESRGAHSRIDFPERDDIQWLKHSLYSLETGLDYKPVRTRPMSVESFPPKPRVY
jgi:succinate dehydrogenase / fumarate reductase flavoprotein subunit